MEGHDRSWSSRGDPEWLMIDHGSGPMIDHGSPECTPHSEETWTKASEPAGSVALGLNDRREKLRHYTRDMIRIDVLLRIKNPLAWLGKMIWDRVNWQKFYFSSRIVNELSPKFQFLRVLSLSCYSVTELSNSIDGSNMLIVTEWRGLSDLRGTLAIIGLHNAMNVQDAREANLLCKQGLKELTLTSSSVFDDSRSETLKYEVLKPHTKLAKLKIVFYGDIAFPSWVCDPSFVDITNLTLEHGGWEELPFNLGNIDDHAGAFPQLHNLTICDCPVLVRISVPSLPSLRMEEILGLSKLHEGVVRSLGELEIEKCVELQYLWEEKESPCLNHINLVDLSFINCLKLEKLPNLENCVISLKNLDIRNCL
ncbi:hypothetical protein LguiA_004933 [Lonicera macranthoides]